MNEKAKEININDIEGFRIGQAEKAEAGTGCTVIIAENEMAAGLDVRGGSTASRESEILKPMATIGMINAVLLSGGSAFGLGAADGVMKYLEERGIGYNVGVTKVPIVCQSSLFDLKVGDCFVRPDSEMAYQACLNSENKNYKNGNYGAGCGATVGKQLDMEYCMKSGIGSYAIRLGKLEIGAVTVVNALGDIYDAETGEKIAGLLAKDKKSLLSTEEVMCENYKPVENKFVGNTTLCAVITNGKFNKTQLCKIASMAHNGYGRSINPVHTSADGDTIYALSSGKVAADIDLVGTLAARVVSCSITSAIKSAKTAYGFISYEDIISASK